MTNSVSRVGRRAAIWQALVWLALAGQAVWAQAAEPAAAPPALSFYRHPHMGRVALSPSGRQLALTVNVGERLALAVLDLEGGAAPKVAVHYSDADVRDFHWVNDQRLVYTVVDLQRGSGDQDFAPGLFAVNADGSGGRMLVRLRRDFLRNAAPLGRQPLEWNHILLHVPTTPDGSGNEVIVGRLSHSHTGEPIAVLPFRLNVDDLSQRSLAEGMPANGALWLFDRSGEPRAVTSYSQAGQMQVHWRAPGANDWRLLATMPSLKRSWTQQAVDDQGGLYVTATQGPAGTTVLKRFDLATGKPVAEALVSTPGYDFHGELVQDLTGPVLGVRATTDAQTTVWFDLRLAGWQAEADQRLPGRVNRIDCRRCSGDDPVLLVRSWSDQQPGELFVLRPTRSAGRWDPVGMVRKDIEPRRMATLDRHLVTTRDGLVMPVWLTLPRPALAAAAPSAAGAAVAPGRRPAVLLVHGGPWSNSGDWHWRDDAQFLASRAYVVIEPEFRGSTGFGSRHLKAGFKQWGRAMQDDLEDALQWAIAQGHVDPQRVCIAGGSYGGYAALMGPIRHPGRFRCAAAWMAVSDPLLLFQRSGWSDMSDEARRYSMPEMLGDPQADAAMLAEVSPLSQAARLKVPVLLAYGAQDRRVPLVHGQRMRDALTEAGNPPEWVVYGDEGHGWLLTSNRVDWASRLEAFLAKHLK